MLYLLEYFTRYIKDRCYTYDLNKNKNETAVSWGTTGNFAQFPCERPFCHILSAYSNRG